MCVCLLLRTASSKQYLGKRSPLGLPLARARYSWKNLAGSLDLPSHPEKTPPPTQSLYPQVAPMGAAPSWPRVCGHGAGAARGVPTGAGVYAQVWNAS